MPYQPMSPTPYLETIDSTVDNTFVCVINPRDIISKYVLRIVDMNSTTGESVLTVTEDEAGLQYAGTSSQIDTSILIDNLQLPLYGTYKNDTMLKIPIPANYILDKSEETSETEDEDKLYGDYIWNITLYDNHDNAITSCDYYFKVRDKANIELFNNDVEISTTNINDINSGNIYVQATYSQAQNILPAYYCFNLYLGNDIVYTTGNVVSSNIIFEYDSLISGNEYKLELLILDDDKTQTKYTYDLNVAYDYFSAPINPVVNIDTDKEFVSIDYSYNISIVGKYDEDEEEITFDKYKLSDANEVPAESSNNAACIPENQILFWDEQTAGVPLELDGTNQIIHWHGHEAYEGIIIEKLDPSASANAIIVGHDIPNSITHSNRDDLIYVDTEDENMPIGIARSNMGAGFYYKFGTSSKMYISEFLKLTSAIYKSETAVADESSIVSKIDDDTLYILNDTDEIADNNVLLSNDASNRYWWVIGILNDSAIIYRSEKFSETVVSD